MKNLDKSVKIASQLVKMSSLPGDRGKDSGKGVA
jgi:hypothetical protein